MRQKTLRYRYRAITYSEILAFMHPNTQIAEITEIMADNILYDLGSRVEGIRSRVLNIGPQPFQEDLVALKGRYGEDTLGP